MEKIGFIGVGNMATQIINGLNDSSLKVKLYGFNHNHVNKHVEDLTKDGIITITKDVNELVRECDCIIFAVRVEKVREVCKQIDPELITSSKVFASVAAGITLQDYENYLGAKTKLIRVMPNINSAIKESMTALCPNKNVSDSEIKFVEKLFKQIGQTVIIPETQFDVFMSIAGSFPAMIFELIDVLSQILIQYGVSGKTAKKISVQTIKGSADYAESRSLDNNDEISTLISSVATPGGTTEKGIEFLKNKNIKTLIEESIKLMMK